MLDSEGKRRTGKVEKVNLLANLPSTTTAITAARDHPRWPDCNGISPEKTSEAEAVYYDEHMHLHLPFHCD